MKNLVITYFLLLLLVLANRATLAQDEVDFDSLIPADELAAQLGQNETLKDNNEDLNPKLETEEPDLNSPQGFHHPFWPRYYPYPVMPYVPVPYPHPYPVPVPFTPVYRAVTCYASDMYGYTWSAWSYDVYAAQRMAVNQCFTYSNQGCYARGCN